MSNGDFKPLTKEEAEKLRLAQIENYKKFLVELEEELAKCKPYSKYILRRIGLVSSIKLYKKAIKELEDVAED